MKVSIVIPNWNGQEKLQQNLPKVLKVRGVDEVIVSDDASTDQSLEVLKDFPQVKVIKRLKNGGFASNVNTGVKEAASDLVFILNTDAVPEIDCVEVALPYFNDPQVFSVGCNVGSSWAWAKWQDGFFWHRSAKELPKGAHQTLWASGGGSLFRKDLWDLWGGMDELYNPYYEEDVDLGYRATKRGFINLWVREAKVEHYKQIGVIAENFSKSTVSKVAERNHLIFIWKNITSEKLFRDHVRALTKYLVKHPKYWVIFAAAVKKLNEIQHKRRVERHEQKLTDEQILGKFNLD